MQALEATRDVTSSMDGDDERALLIGLELLLEREEEVMIARNADGLAVLAEERERMTERLAEVARARRAGPLRPAAEEKEMIELYQRLRHRHSVRAQVLRRHAEVNVRAIGVLAQATGQTNLYKADGRVPMQFISA
jgi:hypothetical protein